MNVYECEEVMTRWILEALILEVGSLECVKNLS